jgi:hypothetical protein
MARPVSYNAVITAIQTAANEISGIGTFDLNPGGPSPWIRNGGQPTFHWWAEVLKSTQKLVGIPGAARALNCQKTYLVMVEGWYPVIAKANSISTWDAKFEQLVDKLETKRFLGMNVGIMLENLTIVLDGQAMKTSLHQGDQPMLCHHGVITLKYVQEYEFTTVD